MLAEGTADLDTVTPVALYVYGIVRAGALRSIDSEGVAGKPVQLIERGGLAAVVSPLPSTDLRVKRRDLHAHLQVVEAAFADTTILPCPFGTVVESRDELRDGLLGGAQRSLLAGIERLKGTAQINVKAAYDEDALLREIVAADPDVAHLRERTRGSGNAGYYERLQLGELVAARVAERRELDAARLVRELEGASVDVLVEEPDEGGALKAAFLVLRKRLGRFDSALESIATREQPLLHFEAIGPLPPTAFATGYTIT